MRYLESFKSTYKNKDHTWKSCRKRRLCESTPANIFEGSETQCAITLTSESKIATCKRYNIALQNPRYSYRVMILVCLYQPHFVSFREVCVSHPAVFCAGPCISTTIAIGKPDGWLKFGAGSLVYKLSKLYHRYHELTYVAHLTAALLSSLHGHCL